MFSNGLGKAIRDILMRHSCSGNRYTNTRLLEEELCTCFSNEKEVPSLNRWDYLHF